MPTPILATKLYIPPPRATLVVRPQLIERLSEILSRKLTLISAPAGFGKTTLLSEWCAAHNTRAQQKTHGAAQIAWLSLDKGDNDRTRFLIYLIAGLQTIAPNLGASALRALQSPQPPSNETLLAALLNEITTLSKNFVLVLDDYHVIDAKEIDDALAFLLEHAPPQMHLVIATREDPHLPLARLRARNQLTELRVADLRFTHAEAAEFLNQVMGLHLSTEDVAALETRTEGWIAGLQLAALSMQGHPDTTDFIKSFTGSHHFVLDYLMQEVMQQQSESVQTFLLRTSIIDRMCGPLCDALLQIETETQSESSSFILESLERANLFLIPLDNERRWYRYHHLFAELLRQRLQQSVGKNGAAELHIRASQWFEDNGLEIEAFQHAAAANDIERAERLIQGGRIPLHSLAAVTAIIDWLDSLPTTVLDASPWLWVRSATSVLMSGQTTGVEEKLQAAEKAMQNADLDDQTRDLIGQIAAIRATLANLQYQPDTAILQARRALEYLHPNNLLFRSRAHWALGFALRLLGDRAAARQSFTEAIQQASGNIYHTVLATTGLGQIQESDNQLYQAVETYGRSLQQLSDQGPPNASEEYIGLARIFYEWNDLDVAEQYGQQSYQLARQYDRAIDLFIINQVFLARVKLARGDMTGAAAILAEAEESVRQRKFVHRIPEVVAAQVELFLCQGNVSAAAELAHAHKLPMSQARVWLAQGNTSAALAILEPFRQEMEARRWQDERLKVMVLQSVALALHGEKHKAVCLLGDALALAEPGGFIRLFVDEGEPMRLLISDFRLNTENQTLAKYADKLSSAFPLAQPQTPSQKSEIRNQKSEIPLEPLSARELEVLQLLAEGFSNREIGEKLFLALNTVKGHNRRIFDKLQVQRRTEAIARARELGLL